jgi:hypothetical protein
MAKELKLNGTVAETYPGDKQMAHLGGRVAIRGEGFSLDANLPMDEVRKLALGDSVTVIIVKG